MTCRDWKASAPKILMIVCVILGLIFYFAFKEQMDAICIVMVEWFIEKPIWGSFLSCLLTTVVIPLCLPYSGIALATGYALNHAYDS